MPVIGIRWIEDEHVCESCGSSYALGAEVSLDGQMILSLAPSAYCYGGDDYDASDVYERVLQYLGYTIEETD